MIKLSKLTNYKYSLLDLNQMSRIKIVFRIIKKILKILIIDVLNKLSHILYNYFPHGNKLYRNFINFNSTFIIETHTKKIDYKQIKEIT